MRYRFVCSRHFPPEAHNNVANPDESRLRYDRHTYYLFYIICSLVSHIRTVSPSLNLVSVYNMHIMCTHTLFYFIPCRHDACTSIRLNSNPSPKPRRCVVKRRKRTAKKCFFSRDFCRRITHLWPWSTCGYYQCCNPWSIDHIGKHWHRSSQKSVTSSQSLPKRHTIFALFDTHECGGRGRSHGSARFANPRQQAVQPTEEVVSLDNSCDEEDKDDYEVPQLEIDLNWSDLVCHTCREAMLMDCKPSTSNFTSLMTHSSAAMFYPKKGVIESFLSRLKPFFCFY